MTGIMCGMFSAGRFNGTYTGTAGVSGSETGFTAGGVGTITPGQFIEIGSPTFTLLLHDSSTSNFYLEVDDVRPNSGWTTITVNGTPFSRASAIFTNGVFTRWRWTGVGSNPFTGGSPYTAVVT